MSALPPPPHTPLTPGKAEYEEFATLVGDPPESIAQWTPKTLQEELEVRGWKGQKAGRVQAYHAYLKSGWQRDLLCECVEPNPGPPIQKKINKFLEEFSAGADLKADVDKILACIKQTKVPYGLHTEEHLIAFFKTKTEADIEAIVGLEGANFIFTQMCAFLGITAGLKGPLEQHIEQLQKQTEEQAKQIEEQAKHIKELESERPAFDAISKISSAKFNAKLEAANIQKNFNFDGNIWDKKHRCEIDQVYTWLTGSEASQYKQCVKFIQEGILPDKIKGIQFTMETQVHNDQGLRISGTLGDLSSMISQNNVFIFELKKTVVQNRNLLQACLAIVLVSRVRAQGSVRALFTDLMHIYAGLHLHEGLLDVWPLTDLPQVHHFLEESFTDGSNLDYGSKEENTGGDEGGAGGDEEGAGGSKDGGGKKDDGGRKDGGTGDQGDKRGTKRSERSGGATNNKQHKTQQNTRPLFKTDFDLDLVVEQATSLPVEDQFDYFLQVCEPYLADI